MMLFLMEDIRDHVTHRALTKSDCAAAVLPSEISWRTGLMINVVRTRAFEMLDAIGDRKFRRNRRGDVNVVFNISNCVNDNAGLFRLA